MKENKMKNHWIEKRTEELRPLLTLLVDKINQQGMSMGAHRKKNWHTNECYENSNIEKMQGTLDRIGKVKYHKCYHRDTSNKRGCYDISKCPILGEGIFDHSMRFEWKELFGMGEPDNKLSDILKGSHLQDSVGNWHAPMDTGIWITLWHPSVQKFQEKVFGCWNNSTDLHWRPKYHFTEKEVEDALQIMCKEFNWEYEKTRPSKWTKM